MDGQRKALIVAVDEYEHDGLRDLRAPAADAAALSDVLGDPEIGGFDVRVISNKPSFVVAEEIEELFSSSRSADELLLHFSCHGLKSEAGELFFAARNTRPNRLRSTAVAAEFVQRCMRVSRSRSVVLFLDCCYGGAFGQSMAVRTSGDVNLLDSFPRGKLGGGRGRAVITACSSMEYAFEGDQLTGEQGRRPSVFTNAVVEGLASGDADRDDDGLITLDELYNYVFDRVREQNPNQTPSRDIEMQGEFVLARSRRQRVRSLPIPLPLREAMKDSNMYARLGAIAELRLRLAGDDLPSAAGAYEALAEIARTDIKHVADAATSALGEATVRPTEQQLDFGILVKGTQPPPRTIHLLGPPLARACTVNASHSWVRTVETTGGIQVSVDTSHPGKLSGEITLTALTGGAVIPVHAEVSQSSPEPPASTKDMADLVAPANFPRFHRAMQEVTTAADPDDVHIRHLTQLITEGARYYRVATERLPESPDWARRIDSWRRAVAETHGDETVMIRPGPPQPREIVDTVHWLATEITSKTGVHIPVDEFRVT